MTRSRNKAHRSSVKAPKPWRRVVVVAVLAVLLLVVGTGVSLTVAIKDFVNSGKIARNVFIEGIPMAGRTVSDAAAALQREWVPRLPKEVELKYPGGSLTIAREKLGAKLQIDRAAALAYRVGRQGGMLERVATQIRLRRQPVHIQVECTVNEEALDAALAEIAAKVNRKPRNAEVEVTDNEDVIVKPHRVGMVLNLQKSKQALINGLKSLETGEVTLVVTEQQPHIRAEDLRHLDCVLGSYTTRFNPNQVGRTKNIRLAVRAINKSIVMPGDVFSINDTVGERSAERGFERAPIFGEGGALRDDYGGGLCQVASTLFNAALRANLKIIERSQHNRMVTYVPLGLDAMVTYGNIDMRFRNSLEYPILILGYVSEDELTFKIIGSKSDKAEVKIERSNVGTIPPPTKEIKDPNLEEGKRILEEKGWSGGYATAWRLTKIDGEWVRTWSATSRYNPGPNVYRVGTKKKEQQKPEEAQPPTVPSSEKGKPATSDSPSSSKPPRAPATPPKPEPDSPTSG